MTSPTTTTTCATSAPIAIDASAPLIRPANEHDINAIVDLLAQGAAIGTSIARTPGDVRAHLAGFFIAQDPEGTILACGAVETIVPGLGEIRSVAVAPSAAGRGTGRGILTTLVDHAATIGLLRLVLLTRVPAFFARVGFLAAPFDHLPHAYVQYILLDRERTFTGKTCMVRSIASASILS